VEGGAVGHSRWGTLPGLTPGLGGSGLRHCTLCPGSKGAETPVSRACVRAR
jgi:hypothetical protein